MDLNAKMKLFAVNVEALDLGKRFISFLTYDLCRFCSCLKIFYPS